MRPVASSASSPIGRRSLRRRRCPCFPSASSSFAGHVLRAAAAAGAPTAFFWIDPFSSCSDERAVIFRTFCRHRRRQNVGAGRFEISR